MVGDKSGKQWRSWWNILDSHEKLLKRGRSFVTTISFISVFTLLIFCATTTPASAVVKLHLEGYTLEPQEKWTAGAIKGWPEGACIPFHCAIENTGSAPEPLNLKIIFDNKRDGRLGILDFMAFEIPAGTISGPFFDDQGHGSYNWIVTLPKHTKYTLKWCAELSNSAWLWPGASMHVSAENGGSRDVPIIAKNIKIPDIYAMKIESATCDAITYTINYGNAGEAAQIRTVLMDDFNETIVEVADAGGGTDNGNKITWSLGTINRGETGSVSYRVSIKRGAIDGDEISTAGFITGILAEEFTENNHFSASSKAKRSPVADAGQDRSIIPGVSTVIGGNPTASGCSGECNCRWSPAAGLDDPSKPNPIASPVDTTAYTITVIDDDGCSDVDEMKILVAKAPKCMIDGPEGVCEDSPEATFYYIGEDTSTADFSFTWWVDGKKIGTGEDIKIDWQPFDFGVHTIILDVVKTYPIGADTANSCEFVVTYVESPSSSINMLEVGS